MSRLAAIVCLLLWWAETTMESAHAQEPISPIPETVDYDADKARLGKKLFTDTRLSRDDTISCHSCHQIDMWGTDLVPVSTGIDSAQGRRNSPTVFNAVFNFRQFWDGRADDLPHQAEGPVIDPVEMGMASWEEAELKLKDIEEYRQAFQQVYGTGVTREAITDALAEYQKTLITPNSPFDQYLRGDQAALDDEQMRGYELFKAYGCVSCHQGRNVGGNMYQKFGVVKDIKLRQDSPAASDLGRFEITGNNWDKFLFKVPSLRLAAKTPPYFHDGSAATLEQAVSVMIEFQLGRQVPDTDRQAIIAFLESLVGEHPEPEALEAGP